MGNVSTRVTVSDAERRKILEEARRRTQEARAKAATTEKSGNLPIPTVEDRKKRSSSQTDKTPAKRRKPAA